MPKTGLECVSSGVWRAGLPRAFLLVLALPMEPMAHRQGPAAEGKKPRWQEEAWLTTAAETSCWGWAGRAQLPHTWRGVPCHLGGRGTLPELESAENTGVESLNPWWVFRRLSGAGAGIGEFRFSFCCLLLLFLTWGQGATKTCLGTANDLSKALGGSSCTPPFCAAR